MKLSQKIPVLILAIIGIALTIKLGIIYWDVNFNDYALPSFCSINDYVDCDGVAKTTHSQAFGVPLWAWGLFFYLFVIMLCFVDKLKNYKYLSFLEVFKTPNAYIYSLGLLAFVISMTLAFVSIYEINKICILCFATYFINFLIALFARTRGSRVFGDIKTSVVDFINAVKIKKYLIAFLSVVFVGIAFLAFTSTTLIFAPNVKKIKSIEAFKNIKGNPYGVGGNVLGDPNAKVVIHEYTDFECPHCSILNIMLQRIVSELDNVKVVHHNFPLDTHCNSKIGVSIHENSCFIAKYALAAEFQGKYWNLNNYLFEYKPNNEKDILHFAKQAGLDVDKLKEDAASEKVAKRLEKSIDDAYNLKIIGTPSIIINSKVYTGIMPYYELKELLIKSGAIEKK